MTELLDLARRLLCAGIAALFGAVLLIGTLAEAVGRRSQHSLSKGKALPMWQALVVGLVSRLAKNLLPTDWIKRQLTGVLTLLLARVFTLADQLAKRTEVTDLDDKAVAALRAKVMAEGVIAHLVDVAYALLMGATPPAPVDPVNPPSPPAPPAPSGPGILRRLINTLWGGTKKLFRD